MHLSNVTVYNNKIKGNKNKLGYVLFKEFNLHVLGRTTTMKEQSLRIDYTEPQYIIMEPKNTCAKMYTAVVRDGKWYRKDKQGGVDQHFNPKVGTFVLAMCWKQDSGFVPPFKVWDPPAFINKGMIIREVEAEEQSYLDYEDLDLLESDRHTFFGVLKG